MNRSYYCHILGVSENAGIEEIKEAFRRKAKEFHPDLNKAKDASDRFIDINEAYTCLMDIHSRSTIRKGTHSEQDEYFSRWVERERQKARARAAKRARMRFEEFKRSSIYKTTSRLSHLLDYFLLFLGIFIIIAAGFGLYTQGLYITENDEEVFNLSGVVADVIITLAGILFILLSWGNIKAFRKSLKKEQYK